MLPRWMQRAVKAEVISPDEAQEIYKLSLESETDWVELPPHLFNAAERIHLWERLPANSLPV